VLYIALVFLNSQFRGIKVHKYQIFVAAVLLGVSISACTKKATEQPMEKNQQTEAVQKPESPVQPVTDNPQGDPTDMTGDQPILDESGLGAPAQSATPAPAGETPAPAAPAAN
jgi:hypothetical protein